MMKQIVYILLILLAMGCKERYDAPVHSPLTGYLVVDGVVNSGPDSTLLVLSRTTQFSNRNLVYETGALVSLQGADSTVYSFTENGKGQYVAGNLHLNSNLRYRLRITAGGKQYVSDFAAVKNNPPVDSISWRVENGGLQLYVNTHDPLKNTLYYQWKYDETWEFHSSFVSALKYKMSSVPPRGTQYSVVFRDSVTFSYDPTIITCWQFNNPTSIFIGSTAKLSNDVVYLPIAFIPPASVKLGVLYSMRLKQYAWTKEGYEFLDRMKKNTESTGTVFDPQPSELNGNFHCVTDASEPVIGFFNICPVQEKRIFIKNSDVPGWRYNAGCIEVVIENISDSISKKGLGLLPTVPETFDLSGGIATFRAAPPDCVDCTLSGTNKKPLYWP